MNLSPFKRNNYYFGKLLSVGDFELEQAYFRQKMHLMNKIAFKEGVVEGLEVKTYEDNKEKIVIHPGICVDEVGEMIVVHEEVVVHLSDIEGFEIDRDVEDVFLSIYYDEISEGEALTLEHSHSSGQTTYNQVIESYGLYLSVSKDDMKPRAVPLAKIHAQQLGTDYEIKEIEAIRNPITKTENSGYYDLEVTAKEACISEDINHGLGKGKVKITLNVMINDEEEACIYNGHQSLLEDLNLGQIAYGSMLYPDKGTFIIVAKGETLKAEKVKFLWHATKI